MNQLLKGIINLFIVLILLNIAPPLIMGIKQQYFDFLSNRTKIAQICFNSSIESSEIYTASLQGFFKDPEIKAILLKIESPGGAPGSCQALFKEILYLKKKYPKPIITLTENVCTSGAYYIASSTDTIIASPACLIGGIGSRFTTILNTKKFLENNNVQVQTIAAGKYKTTLSPFADLTQEQTAMLQTVANDTYEQFAHDVALTRKLSFAQKEAWADGKLFTGQQAVKNGLIDATGSYSKMLEKLHALAPIEGEILWIKHQEKRRFKNLLENFRRLLESSLESSLSHLLKNI